jgi:uncharacterized protein YyaL (SSP411 family)
MAKGGVYDQVGGGFHRYSVDEKWIVPHFEKMSYDNSEMLRVYVHAAASLPPDPAGEREGGRAGDVTGDPPIRRSADSPSELYRRTVEGIVHWVRTVMSDPEGGYYASQDADVGLDDDGDYFTWTLDEVKAVADPQELEALVRRFDIEERGEMQHDPRRNVLWIKQSCAEIGASLGGSADEAERLVAAGLVKLAEARGARPAPAVDRTIYTGWSAMMASAMLAAAALLDAPELDQHALATLERLFTDAADPEGGVRHAVGGPVSGLLEDQVHLANAALDAFEATGDAGWRTRAAGLMDHVWDRYRAPGGGLRDRRAQDGEGFLSQPVVPAVDAPTPSPNGVAALVLGRLAEHTAEPRWASRRDELLGAFGAGIADLGLHGATLLRAAEWALEPAAHVVVVAGDDPAGRALRLAARRGYRPRKVLTLLRPGAPAGGLPAPVRAMLDGQVPRAYLCVGTSCRPPVADGPALHQLLRTP